MSDIPWMSPEFQDLLTILTGSFTAVLAVCAPIILAVVTKSRKRSDETDQLVRTMQASLRTNHDTSSPGDSLDKIHSKLDLLGERVQVLGRDVGYLREHSEFQDKRAQTIAERLAEHDRNILNIGKEILS